MGKLFDMKYFNGEVFSAYVDKAPHLERNELLKSGAIVVKNEYAAMLPDNVGGNYISVPIKARIGGTPDNYDGATDIKSDSRKTYLHGRIVIGRAHGWTEKDFSADISGEDFMPAAAEVAEYWDDVNQRLLLSTLKGVFAMSGGDNAKFVTEHTYDISAAKSGPKVFDETTLNNAMQQALGDNKAKFALTVMHSVPATHLENLKLLDYMKYTDEQGIERNLALATLNGRLALIDDGMPTETASDEGGTYTKYTTYVLGLGAIEETDCGVQVPSEMDRNAAHNGGETTLYSRERKIMSPYGISFKPNKTASNSPTDSELENGANWELASGSGESFPRKAIPIARIITRG